MADMQKFRLQNHGKLIRQCSTVGITLLKFYFFLVLHSLFIICLTYETDVNIRTIPI